MVSYQRMISVDLAKRYLQTGGGVPQQVINLHAAEASLGDRFIYRGELDSAFVRGLLGFDGTHGVDLPSHEVVRLAEMLLRFGQITDEELTHLGLKKVGYG